MLQRSVIPLLNVKKEEDDRKNDQKDKNYQRVKIIKRDEKSCVELYLSKLELLLAFCLSSLSLFVSSNRTNRSDESTIWLSGPAWLQ